MPNSQTKQPDARRRIGVLSAAIFSLAVTSASATTDPKEAWLAQYLQDLATGTARPDPAADRAKLASDYSSGERAMIGAFEQSIAVASAASDAPVVEGPGPFDAQEIAARIVASAPEVDVVARVFQVAAGESAEAMETALDEAANAAADSDASIDDEAYTELSPSLEQYLQDNNSDIEAAYETITAFTSSLESGGPVTVEQLDAVAAAKATLEANLQGVRTLATAADLEAIATNLEDVQKILDSAGAATAKVNGTYALPDFLAALPLLEGFKKVGVLRLPTAEQLAVLDAPGVARILSELTQIGAVSLAEATEISSKLRLVTRKNVSGVYLVQSLEEIQAAKDRIGSETAADGTRSPEAMETFLEAVETYGADALDLLSDMGATDAALLQNLIDAAALKTPDGNFAAVALMRVVQLLSPSEITSVQDYYDQLREAAAIFNADPALYRTVMEKLATTDEAVVRAVEISLRLRTDSAGTTLQELLRTNLSLVNAVRDATEPGKPISTEGKAALDALRAALDPQLLRGLKSDELLLALLEGEDSLDVDWAKGVMDALPPSDLARLFPLAPTDPPADDTPSTAAASSPPPASDPDASPAGTAPTTGTVPGQPASGLTSQEVQAFLARAQAQNALRTDINRELAARLAELKSLALVEAAADPAIDAQVSQLEDVFASRGPLTDARRESLEELRSRLVSSRSEEIFQTRVRSDPTLRSLLTSLPASRPASPELQAVLQALSAQIQAQNARRAEMNRKIATRVEELRSLALAEASADPAIDAMFSRMEDALAARGPLTDAQRDMLEEQRSRAVSSRSEEIFQARIRSDPTFLSLLSNGSGLPGPPGLSPVVLRQSSFAQTTATAAQTAIQTPISIIAESIASRPETLQSFFLATGGTDGGITLFVDWESGRAYGAGTATLAPGSSLSAEVVFAGQVNEVSGQIEGTLTGHSNVLDASSDPPLRGFNGSLLGASFLGMDVPLALLDDGTGTLSITRRGDDLLAIPDLTIAVSATSTSLVNALPATLSGAAQSLDGFIGAVLIDRVTGLPVAGAPSDGIVTGLVNVDPAGNEVALAATLIDDQGTPGDPSDDAVIPIAIGGAAGLESGTASVLDERAFAFAGTYDFPTHPDPDIDSLFAVSSLSAELVPGFSYLGWGTGRSDYEFTGPIASALSPVVLGEFDFIFGEATASAAVPGSGTASYTGPVNARAIGIGNGQQTNVGGTVSLTVDFLAKTVGGSLALDPESPSLPGFSMDLANGALGVSEFEFDLVPEASATGIAANFSGGGQGAFFGPAAEEAGGLFNASNFTDEIIINGTFAGKQ